MVLDVERVIGLESQIPHFEREADKQHRDE